MKGTFFSKNLEFKLVIEGESWRQGDLVSGVFSIRNHGGEARSCSGIRLTLADGTLSRVKKKAANAFEAVESFSVGTGELAPKGETSVPWKFQTDRNCTISDGSKSLFLCYGEGEALETLGQIQLPVLPHSTIEMLVKVLNIEHYFVVKSQKNSKGKVVTKLDVPDARTLAALESLELVCWMDGETLQTEFIFHVQKIDPSAVSKALQKQEVVFERSFAPAEYRLPSGRMTDEFMASAIKKILDEAGLKSVLPKV